MASKARLRAENRELRTALLLEAGRHPDGPLGLTITALRSRRMGTIELLRGRLGFWLRFNRKGHRT